MARNSCSSAALNVISFSRFTMSRDVCGISSREIGLICTSTTSCTSVSVKSGNSAGLPM